MHRQIRMIMYIVIAFFFVLAIVAAAAGMNKEEEKKRSSLESGDAALRYPYSRLNEREKALYTALCEGISEYRHQIRLPDTFTAKEYEKVYLTVSMQEPEFFYLDEVYELSDVMETATIHYAIPKEEAEIKRQSLEAVAESILSYISPIQTDGQKMLIIHDEIARRCTYMEPAGMKDSAYTALVLGTSRCEGYAKAFLYLCRRAGLDAMCVTGRSDKGVNHVWNKAKFGEKYYNVDVTWDDDDSYNGHIVHSCFAMPDDLFTDHIVDTKSFVPPVSSGTGETYYYQRGYQVRELSQLMPQIGSWFANMTDGMVEFQCMDQMIYDEAVRSLREEPAKIAEWNPALNGTYYSAIGDRDRQIVVIIVE